MNHALVNGISIDGELMVHVEMVGEKICFCAVWLHEKAECLCQDCLES